MEIPEVSSWMKRSSLVDVWLNNNKLCHLLINALCQDLMSYETFEYEVSFMPFGYIKT